MKKQGRIFLKKCLSNDFFAAFIYTIYIRFIRGCLEGRKHRSPSVAAAGAPVFHHGARGDVGGLQRAEQADVPVVVIGPTTELAARSAGLRVAAVAPARRPSVAYASHLRSTITHRSEKRAPSGRSRVRSPSRRIRSSKTHSATPIRRPFVMRLV